MTIRIIGTRKNSKIHRYGYTPHRNTFIEESPEAVSFNRNQSTWDNIKDEDSLGTEEPAEAVVTPVNPSTKAKFGAGGNALSTTATALVSITPCERLPAKLLEMNQVIMVTTNKVINRIVLSDFFIFITQPRNIS